MEVSSEKPVHLAYFYPHSNTCPERQKRAEEFGVDLQSFRELYKQRKPVFHNHSHSNFVLPSGKEDWDDADAVTMAEHIYLAQQTNTGFFWDLYVGCVNDKPIIELQKPFETMLELNQDVPFSVMFSYNRARVVTPVAEGFKETDRTFDLSTNTARWMADYLSLETIQHPQLVKIDGRPVIAFGAFSLSFDNCEEKIINLVKEFKEYATQAWGVEPYTVAVICDAKGAKKAAESNVFDATTGYCYLPSFKPDAEPIQDYKQRLDDTLNEWEEILQTGLPFFAPFSLGWDSSIRAKYSSPLNQLSGQYPHAPIVVNNTDEVLKEAAEKILDFNKRIQSPILPIFSFNEAEEGAAMLPKKTQLGISYSHTNAMLEGFGKDLILKLDKETNNDTQSYGNTRRRHWTGNHQSNFVSA